MKKIGIVGCGAIGSGIAEFVCKKLRAEARVVALCDIDPKKAKDLSKKITPHPIVTSIKNLVKKSDLIIEAAGMGISAEIADEAIFRGKDALIMSTGGLLKKPGIFKKAKKKGCNIHIPSGAVCGVDGLRAAGIGKIKKVTLTTRKPPRGLKGADYLVKKRIDIDKIKKETVIYSGSASDAVKYFPKNINVAATLSLSGIGPERTTVRIITSPEYTRNVHEVEVEGEFGKLFTRTENVPSKANPKTSQMAIFSALAKIKELV